LLTAREEGKRAAEDRAKKQQSQAVVDLLRQQQAKELQDRGRRARERREADAARAATDKEALEQGQRQRADFILSQLGAESLQGIPGFESQTLADQLKTLETALRRQRTKTDRVPRAVPKPPRDPVEVQAEEREKAILAERVRILRDSPGMSEPDVMRQATERIDQRQFLLESDIRIKDLNAGGSQPPTGGPSQAQEPTSSDDDLSQARQMIQGLDPATARQELQTAGFSADEITRILGG
ncbi:hypothetical protein LCGC14_2063640, partial [marine sediment metagenome]